jgi:nucleoid-associated protein YgaU
LSRSRPRSGGRVDEAAASRSRERARQAATTDARAANRMPAAQRARIRRAEAVDRRADAIAEQGGEAEHGQKGQESPATLPHVVSSGDSASGLHSRSRHGTAVA